MPYLMNKIWYKIETECKKWTLVYSNSFDIKSQIPINKFETTPGRYIYVYQKK